MIRLEISDDLLVRAVTDAVARQLSRVNDLTGYVDLKGACKFLSVGETQIKEWVKLGLIHPRKVSSHLVRFRLDELRDFMEQFKIEKPKLTPPPSARALQGARSHG
jgi:hypothetical protein